MKKICLISSTRADYGLLSGIINIFSSSPEVDFNFVATGTHLSQLHGNTIDFIKADGFNPTHVALNYSGSKPCDIINTMSFALARFALYFNDYKPDILILLGDRYEIFTIAQTAYIYNIPIAHIHGGEVTHGAIDDSLRHAITKFSCLHFTSNEEHRRRVIQLGEHPNTVFNLGAPGLDCIRNIDLLTINQLGHKLNVKFARRNILVTYHPTTINESESIKETKTFFRSLNDLPSDINIFITLPNSDTYSDFVLEEIYKFHENNPIQVYLFKSLGQQNYLSLMNIVDAVVGNSSSGIIEAPFMGKAVVNVGTRQSGRSSSNHVIHCNAESLSIKSAIDRALSEDFLLSIKDSPSIYGNGNSSKLIASTILNMINQGLMAKKFYDYKGDI